ncbi:MAG: hypothetical protein ACFFAU_18725 [Candidatus Hodarchaeota archaeon]
MWKLISFGVVFSLIIGGCTYSVPNIAVMNNSNELTSEIREAGTFSLTNTSDNFTLFENWIYSISIGTIFNLTISLDGNSSSGLEIKYVGTGDPQYYWEGIQEFSIHPNETHSELYVNHYVSDVTPLFNFQYYLIEPDKSASGTYCLEQTHPGYAVTVGTGNLYVKNITLWLEQLSSTQISYSSPVLVVLTVVFCVYSLKLITKKEKNP